MNIHFLAAQRLFAAAALISLLVTLVAVPSVSMGQVKGDPLGSMFTPAHWPHPTDQDVLHAILEIGAIGGHASYMWQWGDGNSSYLQMQALTPLFRQ